MILTKIDKTLPNYKQPRCLAKCDICEKEYSSEYVNLIKCYETYSKDLCRSCKHKHHYAHGLRNSNHILEYNKRSKGVSLEERVGKESADSAKTKMSISRSGKGNPNFGAKYSGGFRDRPLSGPIEQRYGKEKADKMKAKMSLNTSGENNPMFGKPSPKGSGNGWKGWYKDEFFRSLMELSYILYLEKNNIIYKSAESSQYKIEYEFENKKRNYFPDFILEDGTIIEIKPKALIRSRQNVAKFLAAEEKYPKQFKVVTEDDIAKIQKAELCALIENGDIRLMEKYYSKLENYEK